MKRTAEFVLGLIGGILGIIIAFITLVGAISLLHLKNLYDTISKKGSLVAG